MMGKKVKVFIDAGHYGKYNRAPGVPAYYESEVMWKLSLKQKAKLEAYGIQAVFVREKQEVDKPLFDRGYAAKGGDLFLSNHSNAAERKTADFVWAYHLTEDSGTDVDEISKAIAQKLAPVIAETMGVQEGWEVLSRLAASDKNKDGMKNDNYYGVLNGARQAEVPGIILEHSFHTNDDMARWLLEDANLDRLAQAEADAIAAYFGVEKPVREPESDYCLELRYLRRGDRGEAVRALQRLLIAAGYDCGPLGADGNFGGRTLAALIRYQTDKKLEPDGVVGPKTMAKLLGI